MYLRLSKSDYICLIAIFGTKSDVLPPTLYSRLVFLGQMKAGQSKCLPSNLNRCREAVNVAFNGLFCISGLVFIIMGLWLFVTFSRTGTSLIGSPFQIPWLLIILGITIIISVILASLSSEESLFKLFYSSVLFVYAVLELFTAGYLLRYYDIVRGTCKKSLHDYITNYLQDEEKLMDNIQYQFQCCGADGPTDWMKSPAMQIPPSCCKIHFCNTNVPAEIQNMGCEFVLMYSMNLHLTVIAAMTILLALLPLLGGFLVLFDAHLKLIKYRNIPTEESSLPKKGVLSNCPPIQKKPATKCSSSPCN